MLFGLALSYSLSLTAFRWLLKPVDAQYNGTATISYDDFPLGGLAVLITRRWSLPIQTKGRERERERENDAEPIRLRQHWISSSQAEPFNGENGHIIPQLLHACK